jgi:hypothetical protein
MMNFKCGAMMLLILVSVMSPSAYAASLECNGNIISAGITEEELLDACGEPTSRNGANWVYHRAGFPIKYCECLSGCSNVYSLQSFRALLDIKIYALTFCQCLETIATDGREMYEYIFTAVSWCDKTKTLGVVEPFNCTCCHVTKPLYKK